MGRSLSEFELGSLLVLRSKHHFNEAVLASKDGNRIMYIRGSKNWMANVYCSLPDGVTRLGHQNARVDTGHQEGVRGPKAQPYTEISKIYFLPSHPIEED